GAEALGSSAALVVLLSLAAGVSLALLGALREQQRLVAVRTRTDALDAIADCLAVAESTDELWQTVLQSAAAWTGGPVYLAPAAGWMVRLQSIATFASEPDDRRAGDWVLRSLRIPLTAHENPLVHSLQY